MRKLKLTHKVINWLMLIGMTLSIAAAPTTVAAKSLNSTFSSESLIQKDAEETENSTSEASKTKKKSTTETKNEKEKSADLEQNAKANDSPISKALQSALTTNGVYVNEAGHKEAVASNVTTDAAAQELGFSNLEAFEKTLTLVEKKHSVNVKNGVAIKESGEVVKLTSKLQTRAAGDPGTIVQNLQGTFYGEVASMFVFKVGEDNFVGACYQHSFPTPSDGTNMETDGALSEGRAKSLGSMLEWARAQNTPDAWGKTAIMAHVIVHDEGGLAAPYGLSAAVWQGFQDDSDIQKFYRGEVQYPDSDLTAKVSFSNKEMKSSVEKGGKLYFPETTVNLEGVSQAELTTNNVLAIVHNGEEKAVSSLTVNNGDKLQFVSSPDQNWSAQMEITFGKPGSVYRYKLPSNPNGVQNIAVHFPATGNRSDSIEGFDTNPVEPEDGLFQLIKKSDDGSTLAGVEFEITIEGTTVTRTTDSNGKIEISDLPEGTIVAYKEVAAPDGYEIDPATSEGQVTIKAEGDNIVTVINKKKSTPPVEGTGDFRLVKESEDGEVLEGVEFEIVFEYPVGVFNKLPNRKTDKRGEINFDGFHLNGVSVHYKEVKALPGYVIDPETSEGSILIKEGMNKIVIVNKKELDEPKTGTFQLIKKSDDGAILKDVKFEITVDGETSTKTTDANGKIDIADLKEGTVIEYEEIEAPEGYLLDEATSKGSITIKADEVNTITVINPKRPETPTGSVKITKTVETLAGFTTKENDFGEYNELTFDQAAGAGFKFKIRALEEIKDAEGNIILKKGEFVQEGDTDLVLTTDEKGTAKTDSVMLAGKYELVEIEAPKGVVLPEESTEFTIKSGEDTDLGTTTVKVENTLQSIEIQGQKKQEVVEGWENGKAVIGLEDATNGQVFALGIKEDLVIGEETLVAGSILAYATVENGKLIFEDLKLPNVKAVYFVQEVNAGSQHVLDETKHEFTYDPTTNDKLQTIVVEPAAKESDEDSEDAAVDEDADKTDKEDTESEETESTEKSSKKSEKNTSADDQDESADEESKETEDVESTEDTESEIQPFINKLAKADLKVIKVSALEKTPLPGVLFELFYQSDEEVAAEDNTSTELEDSEKVDTEESEELVEETSKESKTTSETETKEDVTEEVEAEETADKDSDEDQNVWLSVGRYETDKNGEISVEKLPAGSYKLVEVASIEGFVSTDEEFDFTISPANNGGLVEITVENKEAANVTIKTKAHGGSGSQIFTHGDVLKMYDDVEITHDNILDGTKFAFEAILVADMPTADGREEKDIWQSGKIDYEVSDAVFTKQVVTEEINTGDYPEGTRFYFKEVLYDEDGEKIAEHNFDGEDRDQELIPDTPRVTIKTKAHDGKGNQEFTHGDVLNMYDDVEITHDNILDGTKFAFEAILVADMPTADGREEKDIWNSGKIDYEVSDAVFTKQVVTEEINTGDYSEGTRFYFKEVLYDEDGEKIAEHNFDGKDRDQELTPVPVENTGKEIEALPDTGGDTAVVSILVGMVATTSLGVALFGDRLKFLLGLLSKFK